VHRSELLAQVSRDQASRVKIESGPSISVLTRDLQAIESHNAVFMWFQLFIEVLLRMNHKASDRAELTAMCKRSYNGNNEQMNIIDEFERNYQPAEAIWWYTRESCFYRMLNKALRVQDFDMLFAFRFFISDIAELVKIEHEKFIRTSDFRNKIKVYRGQVIRKNEINLMKNSINEFLSMNTFLSTSRDRALALIFARINTNIGDDMQPVIFEIEIDPRLRTKAFADITQMSYFKGEDETLIMIGALFRIVKVFEDENERMCVVSLSLASEDDFDLKELFSHMKKKIGDNTGLDSLGKLLLRMGENEKARKCYERMLNETMLAVGDAQLGLGWTHLRCNNADESLEHFEEALKLREHVLGEDHAVVGETYSFLGEVHLENEDHDQALIELNKAIKIQEKTLPSNSLDLAATYASTGNAYTLMEKYDLALKYYQKTLKIRQTTLPSNHPQMAAIYKNIGWMYSCKQNYSEALTYYEKSLEISRKTLPPTHPSIIGTEENIRKLKTPTKN
jgi:tetratricopeptide (TPR) repeat protein